MNIVVGQKYLYRVTPGRGRPRVGQVITNMGDTLEMRYGNTIIKIPAEAVEKPYVFKPNARHIRK